MRELDKQEYACLEALATAWNKYVRLSVFHPSDQQEFCQHIHALQNIILARRAGPCPIESPQDSIIRRMREKGLKPDRKTRKAK